MSASTFPIGLDSAYVGEATPRSRVKPVRDLTLYFVRTEGGDLELRRPAQALSAPARELLFAIEGTLAIEVCVAAARGSTAADAMLLLARGLIRLDSLNASRATRANRVQLRSVVEAILSLPADALYTLLTRHAKLRLGLLHGFRMILALERCTCHEEQRALAVRFVEEVWRAHGEAGLRPLAVSLRS